jgi:DNA-binding MarR family transcriptional regulator
VTRSGPDLALLLLASFRTLVDAATEELAARGYDDVRPSHDFAMRAIASGADSASDLGRAMSVSKQAASKTIAVLIDRGYVTRVEDPRDARRRPLQVTALGWEVMHEGERIFTELRDRWEQRVGHDEFRAFVAVLEELVGDATVRLDAPGWVAHELG